MEITVNNIYLLDIPRSLLNDKISYTNSVVSPMYVWLKQVHGKKVKVKATTKLVTDFYSVILLKGFSQPFYVSKKCLAECKLESIKCTCGSFDLFWLGCQCGAFKRERELA